MKKMLSICLAVLAMEGNAQQVVSVPIQPKTALAVGSDSLVYFGYQSGIIKVYNGTAVGDPLFNLPANTNIQSMAYHPSGALWVGTNTGLFQIVGTTLTQYTVALGNLPGDTVLSLGVTTNGHVLAGTQAGLAVYNGSSWTTYNSANSGLTANRIQSIGLNQNSAGLVADGNPFIFTGSTITPLAFTAGPVRSLVPHRNGGAVVTTAQDAYFVSAAGVSQSLPVLPDVQAVLADRGSDDIYLMRSPKLYRFRNPDLSDKNVEFSLIMTNPSNPLLLQQGPSGKIYILSRMNMIILHTFDFVDDKPNSDNRKQLDLNQVEALYMTTGDMFWDRGGSGNARYNVPKVTNPNLPRKNTLFAVSPWIGGVSNGVLHQSAQTYRQSSVGGPAYQPGPLDANGERLEEEAFYDRLWKINRLDIEYFKWAWQAGNIQNGTYFPPKDIREWPGNRPGGGVLAPYHDQNNDGNYNYLDGDYPLIKGDQAVWGVFNDMHPSRVIGTPPLQLEMQFMAYAFICTQAAGLDTVLNYTTFLDYNIKNKSSRNYQDTYLALWSDGDLGNPTDDYVGMDVGGDGYYFYNGDDNDEGIQGYGLNPPAQGIYQLRGPVAPANDGLDNNRNGVIDEVGEDVAFTNFTYFNNDGSSIGNPFLGTHFYNYARAMWKDSTAMVFGGTGYPGSLGSTNQTTTFMFPGTSDPIGWGLGGTTASPVVQPFAWSEAMPGMGVTPNTPSDRRGVGSMGPFNLNAGAEQSVTFAFIYSRGMSGPLSSVNKLLTQDAPLVRQWYAQGTFPSCLDLSTVDVAELKVEEAQVRFYPNPVQSVLMVELLEASAAEVQLYDLQGRLLQTQSLAGAATHVLDVQALRAGMYLVRVQQAGKLKVYKMVKEE